MGENKWYFMYNYNILLCENDIIVYKPLLKFKIYYITYKKKILSFFNIIRKYAYLDYVTNYQYIIGKKQEIEITDDDILLKGHVSFISEKDAQFNLNNISSYNRNIYVIAKCIIPKGSHLCIVGEKFISSNIIINKQL